MRHGLALVLALGCGTPSAAPPAPPTTPAVAAPVPDDGLAIVSGRLRAHDGSPLRRAEIRIAKLGFQSPSHVVELDAAGTFRVELPRGAYQVIIAAVDHAGVRRTTIVDEDLHIEGTLGTYRRSDPGEVLRVHAELLDASGAVIARGPPEARREGAIHRITLGERPTAAVRMRYQLHGERGRTHNGPTADRFESDGGGDYWSIVDITDRTSIDLDLSAGPPSGLVERLAWRGESPMVSGLIEARDRWRAQIDEVQKRMPKRDGAILVRDEALRREAEAIAAKAAAEIDAAPSGHALFLRALHIGVFAPWVDDPKDDRTRREHVAWIVEHLPADAAALPLLGDVDRVLATEIHGDGDATALLAWLEQRATHPDPGTAISAIDLLLVRADRAHDEVRVGALYADATTERFADTYRRRSIEEQFDPNRPLQHGKPLPAFSFEAIDGRDPIASADRGGRLYLLEFWATWCAPCIKEMESMHRAYATLNELPLPKKGGLRRLKPAKRPKVEFVFVSLDAARDDVTAFRREHWSMPWTHAFVGRDGEKEVMARFGFSGVPTAILVDESGTIVEVGAAVRGDALLPTLERVLSGR